jgi:hypothetical protein
VDWNKQHAIQSIMQLWPAYRTPIDYQTYFNAGKVIGAAIDGKVVAAGNWGIELLNSGSPFRGAGPYDGIKSVAPDLPVLTGNIATDFQAKTLQRLYGAPANGKFDGAVLNAYNGPIGTIRNNVDMMTSW